MTDYARILSDLDDIQRRAKKIRDGAVTGTEITEQARRIVREIDDLENLIRAAESDYRRERRKNE